MNPFTVFGLTPRPWLDPELLRGRHHELSRMYHPDVKSTGNLDMWEQVGLSHALLADEVARLKWLLQDAGISDPDAVRNIPESIAACFVRVGDGVRRAVEMLKRAEESDSQLERALLQNEIMETTVELQSCASVVGGMLKQSSEQLKALDTHWDLFQNVEGLLEVYRSLVYLKRWERQIDEAQFRLMGLG
ncbi:MAG: DnaJ family molecular chaperone [Candidatus Methylacidiphilales bacterium]